MFAPSARMASPLVILGMLVGAAATSQYSSEGIDDEISVLQKDVVLTRPSAEVEEEIGIDLEEEDDEYSAMQTQVVVMVGQRHVGTGRPYSSIEEDEETALFQSQATVIDKDVRSCTDGMP